MWGLFFFFFTVQCGFFSRSSSPKFLDRCRTELTQTDSASSALFLDASTDISRHCAAPFPLDDLTRWTEWL
ncbi:hypothetical protein QN277_001408 [Acacia crassicarpa]|uniref:Uncharacterized protein n=1 Tax=Acacia crassicarpa TaxID=499986 RepID=A0AAE1TIB3_9FABA|nr:hypothetical protein QN277_001408 [Acacia crassicarpa]